MVNVIILLYYKGQTQSTAQRKVQLSIALARSAIIEELAFQNR